MSSLPLHFLRPASLRLAKPIAASAARSSGARAFGSRRYVRLYSSSTPGGNNEGGNSNNGKTAADNMPHISEETNKMREIMGQEKIDVEEVGTPVQEIIQREGLEESAPTVVKEQIERERQEKSEASSLGYTTKATAGVGPLFAKAAQQQQAPSPLEPAEQQVKEQPRTITQPEAQILAEQQRAGELGAVETQAQQVAVSAEPPVQGQVQAETHVQEAVERPQAVASEPEKAVAEPSAVETQVQETQEREQSQVTEEPTKGMEKATQTTTEQVTTQAPVEAKDERVIQTPEQKALQDKEQEDELAFLEEWKVQQGLKPAQDGQIVAEAKQPEQVETSTPAPEQMITQPEAEALAEEQRAQELGAVESSGWHSTRHPGVPGHPGVQAQAQQLEEQADAHVSMLVEGITQPQAEALAEEQRAQELGAMQPQTAQEQLSEEERVHVQAQPQEPTASHIPPITGEEEVVKPAQSQPQKPAADLSGWQTTPAEELTEEERIPTLEEVQLEIAARERAQAAAAVAEPEPEVLEYDPETGKKLTTFKSPITGEAYPPFAVPPPIRPPIPQTPIPANHHLHHRYSPFLEQLIPLFQRHGEKAKAQRVVQDIIRILRTKPVPTQGEHLLVPSTPALNTLPSNPVAYLQSAIDSVAPLVKLKNTAGSGGSKVTIPFPIAVRRRRRTAVEWIMAAADARRKTVPLAERFADECVKVIEGKSSAWDKRTTLHRTAIANRANVDEKNIRKSKKKRM